MKARLLLIPLSPLALVAPAYAVTYLTVEQAQTLMFEGSVLTRDFRVLTPEQIQAIESDSGVKVANPQLNAWRDGAGGWFVLDQVIGKHEFINYAVALDANGAVRQHCGNGAVGAGRKLMQRAAVALEHQARLQQAVERRLTGALAIELAEPQVGDTQIKFRRGQFVRGIESDAPGALAFRERGRQRRQDQ